MNSAQSDNVQVLVEKWRQGDEAAAEHIFGLYWERLWLLAKSRIDQRLSAREGASDAVQSAFKSFFWRARDGQFHLDQSDALWRLLATITLNKVQDRVERHKAQRRATAHEVRLDDFDPAAFAHDPTAEEAVAFADEIEHVVQSLPQDEAAMLGLCLQGQTPSEIADACGCSRWKVRRVLNRIGETLRQRLSEED